MLKIRLKRAGAKKRPFYRIVAADSRMPRDGRFIERVGFFNPVARGQEERLRVANVEIKLEGISEQKFRKVPLDGKTKDSEEVEDGLIIVDLLSLHKKFNWQRYKTDILGFLTMGILVLALIFVAIFLAGIGA